MYQENIANALKKTIMVIPSIDGKKLLETFFPTVDIPLQQVLVVDQGSADGTEDFCARMNANCLQLGAQTTFTKACNLGIKWAIQKKAEYICLANNDLRFATSVVHQLVETLLTEKNVGAVAPTQIHGNSARDPVSHRCLWDLTAVNFEHQHLSTIDKKHEVFDADFCEFTCVVIPTAIFTEIGFLDESYGFYHEDAEFCYRLYLKNYRTVYNQAAQIYHYGSTTVNSRKIDKIFYINKNKKLFANKYLQQGVWYPKPAAYGVDSWAIVTNNMYNYIKKYGLLSQERSQLKLAHPGHEADYLLTVWETTRLPHEWISSLQSYQHIFVPSRWNKEVFQNAGCSQVSFLPFGFDPDYYHPWGEKFDFGVHKSFLIVCHNQYRKALDVSLDAWLKVKSLMPGAWLFLYGTNITLPSRLKKTSTWRQNKLIWHKYMNERVVVLEPIAALSTPEMASLYRGAHAVALNSRSEGFGFTVIDAMACGALTIVPDYGATKEFIGEDNCIPLYGKPIKADYSDKGFEDVGFWWEPSPKDLGDCFLSAYCMSDGDKSVIGANARQFALSNYTWRSSMLHLNQILKSLQKPMPNKVNMSIAVAEVLYNNSNVRKFINTVKQQGFLTALKASIRFTKSKSRVAYHKLMTKFQ